MPNRILYEDDQGRIGKVMPPAEGTVLVGGKRVEWRKLDASLLPYTSKLSGLLSNASVALDHALTLLSDYGARLLRMETAVERVEKQNADVLTETRTLVSRLNTYATDAVTKAQRASHKETAVSIASNPALSIDGQTLKFDLSAKGSFDDSRSQLDANNVQQAIETLVAQNRQLTYQVAALQDMVKDLQRKA